MEEDPTLTCCRQSWLNPPPPFPHSATKAVQLSGSAWLWKTKRRVRGGANSIEGDFECGVLSLYSYLCIIKYWGKSRPWSRFFAEENRHGVWISWRKIENLPLNRVKHEKYCSLSWQFSFWRKSSDKFLISHFRTFMLQYSTFVSCTWYCCGREKSYIFCSRLDILIFTFLNDFHHIGYCYATVDIVLRYKLSFHKKTNIIQRMYTSTHFFLVFSLEGRVENMPEVGE